MPSRRQERVAKRIVQELAEALQHLKHVQLGFITLTKCEVSPDLLHAKIFYSVWGGDEEKERSAEALRQNARALRRMIGRHLGLKNIPDLHFEFDVSLETADRITRLIRDARQSDINPDPLLPEKAADLTTGISPVRNLGSGEPDLFEFVRRGVENELFMEEDDTAEAPGWESIDLGKLPEDGGV